MSAEAEPSSEPMLVRRRRMIVAKATAIGLFESETRWTRPRVHLRLLAMAKEKSGLSSTTEVIRYALAKIVIEDAA